MILPRITFLGHAGYSVIGQALLVTLDREGLFRGVIWPEVVAGGVSVRGREGITCMESSRGLDLFPLHGAVYEKAAMYANARCWICHGIKLVKILMLFSL
ncbi:hypothetical protein GCM10007418_02310 [Halopseudomonas salina]|uniref:Uncharacterized protein n=1 Tax=Halopseudomonas salina TaxID=1323744 RepID=A0ABQ1NWL4_9GAMM|nr:hypothetical protein GCM10007418_02310 [Halopseudomonas salina]